MPFPPLLETDAQLRAQCVAAALRVLRSHGWALVDDWPAFMDEVEAALRTLRPRPGDTLDRRAERAAIRAYCPRLYAACCEATGPRAARAFDELGRYLHAVARMRCRDADIARECAQAALATVWRRLADVREPWAFLGYARVVLVHELEARCQPPRNAPRLVALRGDDADEPGVTLPDSRAEAERADVERAVAEPALRAAIRRCLRSAAQAQVIIRLFLEEESVAAVARALATTAANVWVLKSRALARLRKCPEVVRALGE